MAELTEIKGYNFAGVCGECRRHFTTLAQPNEPVEHVVDRLERQHRLHSPHCKASERTNLLCCPPRFPIEPGVN